MVSIAHLSDPHIHVGPLAGEPAARLHKALGRVLALEPRPDLVVITGDLVEHGRPEEYEALESVLGRFPIPLYLTTGNHDDPAAMLATFGGGAYVGGAKQAYYVVEHPAVTFVALDSAVHGQPGGRLGTEQLAWLDEALAARTDVPAFIGLHHPPAPVGIPFLDGMRLEDGEGLARVVERHPHVVRVLAGHVHRPIVLPYAGTVLATAPSTYRQSSLTMRADGQMGYLDEPTGFLLHVEVEGVWVTHVVPVSHASALLGS